MPAHSAKPKEAPGAMPQHDQDKSVEAWLGFFD